MIDEYRAAVPLLQPPHVAELAGGRLPGILNNDDDMLGNAVVLAEASKSRLCVGRLLVRIAGRAEALTEGDRVGLPVVGAAMDFEECDYVLPVNDDLLALRVKPFAPPLRSHGRLPAEDS